MVVTEIHFRCQGNNIPWLKLDFRLRLVPKQIIYGFQFMYVETGQAWGTQYRTVFRLDCVVLVLCPFGMLTTFLQPWLGPNDRMQDIPPTISPRTIPPILKISIPPMIATDVKNEARQRSLNQEHYSSTWHTMFKKAVQYPGFLIQRLR